LDLFLLLIGDESHINYSQPGVYLSPCCKSQACNITYKTVRIHICVKQFVLILSGGRQQRCRRQVRRATNETRKEGL